MLVGRGKDRHGARLLQVRLPDALLAAGAGVSRLELAPDGRHVAVVASGGAWAVLRADVDGACQLLAVERGQCLVH